MGKIILVLTEYVSNTAQLLAMIVIVTGMFKALWSFIKDLFLKGNSKDAIVESKMELGHSFSLGLGFLIGASILKSVVAPTWDDIGKLTAIIGIRTLLNYFLTRDIVNAKKDLPKILKKRPIKKLIKK